MHLPFAAICASSAECWCTCRLIGNHEHGSLFNLKISPSSNWERTILQSTTKKRGFLCLNKLKQLAQVFNAKASTESMRVLRAAGITLDDHPRSLISMTNCVAFSQGKQTRIDCPAGTPGRNRLIGGVDLKSEDVMGQLFDCLFVWNVPPACTYTRCRGSVVLRGA